MNCKNKFERRFLSPSRLVSLLPLLSMSASLSIRSTISLVRLQSNSLTVHFVCSKTSSLSSVLRKGKRKPLYRSINSFARVENGVCTSVNRPSLLFHSLGSLMALRKLAIFSDLFLSAAVILSLSIYWRILVSLLSSCCRANFFSCRFNSLEFLIFLVSFSRHASNSLKSISKSLFFFGCILRSISTFLFDSSSYRNSICLLDNSASLSSLYLRNVKALFLANHALTLHYM